MAPRLPRVSVLVCFIAAGCGERPPSDAVAPQGSPSPSARVIPASGRVPAAVTLRSGARLSARAAARLEGASEQREAEFLLRLQNETDHALPEGAATASFELGADGVARYRINDVPVAPAEMERFADRSRRLLNERATAKARELDERVRRAIAELGIEDRVVSRGGGAILLRADRATLERVSSRLGERLELIDAPQPVRTAMTNATHPGGYGALEAVRVVPFAHGYNLRGQGIGVWLQEGNQPKTNDPAISSSHLTILTPEAIHSHPTATTSALQQTAPEAMVYYAHEPTSCYLPSVVTQQSDPPVYIGSHSWGYGEGTSAYDVCDAQWDDYVYTNRIAMFFAAGNGANFVGSPGKAYNVSTVGGSNHSAGTMYNASSFNDPVTGAMKPEFVAPGVGIYIRAPDRFCPDCDDVSGTSISAPIAAGFAADMMSGSAFFRNQPQALKAAMLAGATTDIDGVTPLSSMDGAGQINFLHSYFYRSNKWWNGPNNAFFDASGVITESATFTQGDRVRVAISWLTPGSYVSQYNRPSMELSLEVSRGRWFSRVSETASQTFQFVEFTAPETGSYVIRIRRTFNSGQGNVLLALSAGKVV